MIFQMLVITLVVGVCLWAMMTYLTMIDAKVRGLVRAIVILVLVIWWLIFLLQWAGISTGRL